MPTVLGTFELLHPPGVDVVRRDPVVEEVVPKDTLGPGELA